MKKFSIILMISLSTIIILSACASSGGPKKKAIADGSDSEVDAILETKKANHYVGSGPLGSKTNPIKCEGISGAKEYLSKLKSKDGSKVQFEEIGGGGVSPFGGISTIYKVTSTGNPEMQLFFDTTFDGYKEPKAPSGLNISP